MLGLVRGVVAVAMLAMGATRPAEPPILEVPPGPRPALDWNKPVVCASVGKRRLRFQCDEAAKTCLVAEAFELDTDGAPTEIELSRTQPFCTGGSLEQPIADGFRLIRAVAESPPGWVRDDRGRVMQFNFDMDRRLWLGGGFAPFIFPGQPWRAGGEAEFGTRVDFPSDDDDALRRLHLLEGRLDPAAGSFDVLAMSYDWSSVFARPALRFTTFVGKPRRFDLSLNVGLYVLAGRFEIFTAGTPQTWITVAAVEPTLDLWRSKDLESYLRLRAGPAVEHDSVTGLYLFTTEGGADFEDILDRDGFHRLYANVNDAEIFGLPDSGPLTRVEGRAGYELILLAVNDQPISMVLEGRGSWRNDLVSLPPGWDWTAYAGLRFSFWAPARRDAAMVHEAR